MMCGYEIKKFYPDTTCGMDTSYRCLENQTILSKICDTSKTYCGIQPILIGNQMHPDPCVKPEDSANCIKHKLLRSSINKDRLGKYYKSSMQQIESPDFM